MIVSTMLQLKILRTKKRLFDNWDNTILVIAMIGLVITLTFALRATATSTTYGLVRAEIPVLPIKFPDPGFKRLKVNTSKTLATSDPVIMMTDSHFIYGTIESFTSHFGEPHNKFSVPYVKGVPDLGLLEQDFRKWEKSSGRSLSNVLVLLPDTRLPMTVVTQVIALLQRNTRFKKVILAGGLQ